MTNKTKRELLKIFDKIDAQIAAETLMGWNANIPSLLKRIEAELRRATNKKGLSVRVRTRIINLADKIKQMAMKRKK